MVTRVERLPDDLIDKIAAGEVVERPASVVKELVENAVDAGARSVHVEIENGGLALVRVRDDGCGMSREDAQLAIERHATSKLRTLSDLQSIATHGFRGEALPSIAAVSELVLRTRAEGDSAGSEVAVSHGRRVHVRDAGHPRGTTVEVRDLFGAVPARRKFLKAPATEASHVAEAVTLLALARPETGFSLRSAGRTILEAPAVDGLAARIFQLLGAKALDDLVPVEGGTDWVTVRGFVSRPDRPRPARPDLRLFVNRRPVRDRALSKAVLEAFRSAGAGDKGFLAILFVEVPTHVVDVNVHPAKTEVRFADARTVWTAVERAVRERALRRRARDPERGVASRSRDRRRGRAGSARPLLRQDAAARRVGAGERAVQGARSQGRSGARLGLAERRTELAAQVAGGRGRDRSTTGATPRVLGQHRLTYIVATDGDELVLVDQHTAHERVRFEQLLERAERRVVQSQGSAGADRGGAAARAAAGARGASGGARGARLRRRALRWRCDATAGRPGHPGDEGPRPVARADPAGSAGARRRRVGGLDDARPRGGDSGLPLRRPRGTAAQHRDDGRDRARPADDRSPDAVPARAADRGARAARRAQPLVRANGLEASLR